MSGEISRPGGHTKRNLSAALLILSAFQGIGCSSQTQQNATRPDQTAAYQPAAIPFSGSKFDASGVAYVPGTDQVLIVDNNLKNAVVSMLLDGQGRQSGDARSVPLGIDVDDPEDITTDGKYFYVIGSQSKRKNRSDVGLVRFKYDASGTVSEVGVISGLGDLLLRKLPEIADQGSEAADDDGLNIEGLAWDPRSSRLLLGLRSPLLNGQAIVVPLTLPGPDQLFNSAGIQLGAPITLALNELGIRAIAYIDHLSAYLIIAGGTETDKGADFSLWRWDGEGQPQMIEVLDRSIRPEGITEVRTGGSDYLFVVADAGYYFRIDRP